MKSDHAVTQADGVRRLAGRTAVVSGAANLNGIGFAIAKRLAAEGADIAIADIADPAGALASIADLGVRGFGSRLDVSDQQAVQSFASSVTEVLGHVDILVNNVGMYPLTSFRDLTFQSWKRHFAVNVDSQFLMSKAFVLPMVDAGWGRVINITSTVFWLKIDDMVAYVSTKAAVIGFTRSLATEVGAQGVTVNAIAPNIVKTDGVLASANAASLEIVPSVAQAIHRGQLPADLTGAAAFLASDDSEFMTGQTLIVDGGMIRA